MKFPYQATNMTKVICWGGSKTSSFSNLCNRVGKSVVRFSNRRVKHQLPIPAANDTDLDCKKFPAKKKSTQ